MKQYDFNRIIERKGSGAIKTDALEKFFGKKDLIPMWVADMDFETPDFITDALIERMIGSQNITDGRFRRNGSVTSLESSKA